jgi:peptidyl-prolyl cis-trans isomerase SurA
VAPQPAPEKVAAARAKIDAVAKRVAAGEDFAKIATEVSEWPTAKNGGLLGNFRYGDFESEAFDEAVSKLEPGQVSGVIETRFGLQIVKLESRTGEEMTARHIVIKLEATQDDVVRALEKAQSLRRRILKGEDFAALARQESDDVRTRDSGGALEQEVNAAELRPEFRASLDSVQVGGVSSVIRSQDGFYLFKVVARTESRSASYDEVKENLRRYLEQVEVEKRYRSYLADLRKRFHVELKA